MNYFSVYDTYTFETKNSEPQNFNENAFPTEGAFIGFKSILMDENGKRLDDDNYYMLPENLKHCSTLEQVFALEHQMQEKKDKIELIYFLSLDVVG